ncbi:MAG TPA: hypothetical protein DD438_10375 [Verrucomicrobiales bacterium]|nr:hypothetical protein [Verrucomicrobiales bacterium]
MIGDRFLEFEVKGLFLFSIMEFPDDAVSNQFVSMNGNKGLCSLATDVFEQKEEFPGQLPGHVPPFVFGLLILGL